MTQRWFVLLTLGLAAGVFVQSRRTDADEKKAPPLSGKTVYLNLSYVVKNYQKYIDHIEAMRKELNLHEAKVDEKKAAIAAFAKGIKPDLPAEEQEKAKEKLAQLQRELEILTDGWKKHLGRKSDEQIVILYREVQLVAHLLAATEGYDAVLHFNDALPNSPEYYGAENIARKMQAGANIPLYVRPELDISPVVLKQLNKMYKPKKGE